MRYKPSYRWKIEPLYCWRSDPPVDVWNSPLLEVRALLAKVTGASQSLYATWSRARLAREVKAEFAKMNRIVGGLPR